MDFQATDNHSLFGRFLFTGYDQPTEFNPNNVFTGGSSEDSQAYAFTAGSTYLISPETVNAFRLSFSRVKSTAEHQSIFSMSELGSKVYDGYSPGNVSLSATSGFSLTWGSDVDIGTQLYQIADDLTIVRGNHQFGIGGNVGHSRQIMSHGSGRMPNFRFTGLFTGRGLGDFLLGKPSQVNQASGHWTRIRQNFVSLYVQDTWQATPRLTLSAGLRWGAHTAAYRHLPTGSLCGEL